MEKNNFNQIMEKFSQNLFKCKNIYQSLYKIKSSEVAICLFMLCRYQIFKRYEEGSFNKQLSKKINQFILSIIKESKQQPSNLTKEQNYLFYSMINMNDLTSKESTLLECFQQIFQYISSQQPEDLILQIKIYIEILFQLTNYFIKITSIQKTQEIRKVANKNLMKSIQIFESNMEVLNKQKRFPLGIRYKHVSIEQFDQYISINQSFKNVGKYILEYYLSENKNKLSANNIKNIKKDSKKKCLEKEDASKKTSSKNFPTLNDVIKKKQQKSSQSLVSRHF